MPRPRPRPPPRPRSPRTDLSKLFRPVHLHRGVRACGGHTRMKKLFILIGLAAAACSGGARDSVTLSARMATADGQPLRAANGAAEVAPGIELTRARIVVRHLRVEREGEPSELEISTGPLLVDVSGDALSGGLLELVNANVPPGAFDEL